MLKLKNVTFAYDKKPILRNINFKLEKGEQLSIIGESGCGKSTLLQLIYGLHHTPGRIFWEEKELLGPNFNLVPGEPFIKYLAQDFDLMLPLSVADNVGKYLSNMYPRKKNQRIKELLEVVEMSELSAVKAKHLSGGQQQRVALARALAREPEILLLDEPFSHIDHFRKNNLRRRIYSYLKENDITCITATHDSTDALSFADRTMVLKNGKIFAEAPPAELYKNPPNKYVASLFGDINEIEIRLLRPAEESRKKVLLYPHELKLSSSSGAKATVIESFFKGKDYLIKARLNGQVIFFEHHMRLEKNIDVLVNVADDILKSRQKPIKKGD
ncbi:ABC transporter ATP-binding protein [Antarcticibacterium flavum]|uniref:ABC transporter ATP-binding protein n=1 Tax=Antarcticibacterium flavum TaxID=2058175 RepID=A0A5B7X4L6_9FLAO|nr:MULTISPECIES: ABC transporter ATP-binding protein [Antarcticibacterium]MCM4160128.1 ABC transporter ATP-binding protein [Antarcticibacterium sp. W02-3]QCY69681.1 ABC transporter ATP-binding protein [Antarcticibacterium flavum]